MATGNGSLAVIAAAVLWGTTGTAATFAPGVGPLAVGAAAMGIGGLLQALAAARVIRAHRVALLGNWRLIGLSAVATAVYPLAFYTSMRLAGVAIGTVVTIGSAPAISALIERIADKRRLSRRWVLGAGLGVAGIVLLTVARSAHAGTSATHPLAGIALGVAAAATYALYSWGAGRMMGTIPSRAVMGTVFGIGGVLLLPVLVATGAPIVASAQNLTAVAYLAIVPMFLGYVLFGRGLATLPVSTVTTLTLLESAVAAFCAVVVVGEQLAPAGWVGVGLIFVSLVLTAHAAAQSVATKAGEPPRSEVPSTIV